MTLAEERLLSRLIHSVGLSNNLRDIEVREIFESQFRFMYSIIPHLEFGNINPDDVQEMKTNFILKHIGKIYTTPGQVRIKNNKSREVKNGKQDCGQI